MDLNNSTNFSANETTGENSTIVPWTNETSISDSEILLATLRTYGSFYIVVLVIFCLLRKKFYPRLFNVRSWVPELQCDLALNEYGYISWIWEVFWACDDDILDQCGMDALCYIRILRFGRKIATFGSFHAIWLACIYATAPESDETFYITDWLNIISISNVPSASVLFLGTVLAANALYIYTMYLIHKEFEWYTGYRHKFLMQRKPRNYAVYVSGIPEAYRSSYALLEYFGQGSSNSAVLEAHITWDIPKLEQKVTKRANAIKALEHAYAWEQINGEKLTTFEINKNRGIETVETVEINEWKLGELNKEISESIENILNANKTMAIEGMREYASKQTDEGVSPENWLNHPALFEYKVALMESEIFQQLKEEEKAKVDVTSVCDSSSCNLENKVEAKTEEGDDQDVPSNRDRVFSEDSFYSAENQLDGIICDPSDNNKSNIDHKTEEENSRDVLSNRDSIFSDVTFLSAMDGVPLESAPERRVYRKWSIDGKNLRLQGGSVAKKFTTVGGDGVKMAAGYGVDGVKIISGYGVDSVKLAAGIGVDGVKLAAGYGLDSFKMATLLGTNVIVSAGGIVPLYNLFALEGTPREAGFVVFSDLHSAHAARQMIHHPTPYSMEVTEAPDPHDIYWKNVGLPASAKRTGIKLSVVATIALCIFWTGPVAFIASLTEVGRLQETLPFLEKWIERVPAIETALAQIAPIMLIILNDGLLPFFLAWFATWEGHIATPALKASVFLKEAFFMIIQTFFVSAISGGMAELSALFGRFLEDPEYIIDFLANTLPGQSTYFLQLLLVNSLLVQAIELMRVLPIGMALVRRIVGPNLTEKERKSTWCGIHTLEEPQEFRMEDMLTKVLFVFMVLFVYSTISPITNYFVVIAFLMMEFCCRYQFYHNYPNSSDSGGKIWKSFIRLTLACMLIAQFTLIGLLLLKRSVYATPFMVPSIICTFLFINYIHTRHFHITNYLPSRECNEVDCRSHGKDMEYFDFVKGKYLQPSLQNSELYPEEYC